MRLRNTVTFFSPFKNIFVFSIVLTSRSYFLRKNIFNILNLLQVGALINNVCICFYVKTQAKTFEITVLCVVFLFTVTSLGADYIPELTRFAEFTFVYFFPIILTWQAGCLAQLGSRLPRNWLRRDENSFLRRNEML